MAHPSQRLSAALALPVLRAVEALREAAAPPLTQPDAPVSLAALPAVWRAHLLDPLLSPHAPVLQGRDEVSRAEWEALLARVARQLDHVYRLAGLLAAVERGPGAEDLARAPMLAPWAPAWALLSGDLVLTGHPRLGDTWIHTSPLIGIGPQERWARSWSRWYRLGEVMTEAEQVGSAPHRPPVQLIEMDRAQMEDHFAALRAQVARRLEPLSAPSGRTPG